MSDQQTIVDYGSEAQHRVSADTLTLNHKVTLTVPITGSVALPGEVVRVTGVYNAAAPLVALGREQLLAYLSGQTAIVGAQSYYLLGQTLYVLPLPSVPVALTVFCYARSADWTADASFEVSGEAANLVDDLVVASMQLDTGEFEVAAAGLDRYEQAASDLRARELGSAGSSDRLRVQRYDWP